MHTQLDRTLVRVALTIDKRPQVDEKTGKVLRDDKKAVLFEENKDRKPYMVFDEHRDAPKGFAVKVGPRGKSFVVQVRIGTRVIKTKVGDIDEFETMADAYEAAFQSLKTIRETSRNPNTIRRHRQLGEYTLGEVFALYKVYLTTERKTRAKPNSILSLNKGIAKFEPWLSRRVVDITTDEIKARFNALYEKAPTATEAAFRWASSAVSRKIDNDLLATGTRGERPAIVSNPFHILKVNNMYRSRKELEEAYEESRARNPLNVQAGEGENLTAFLNTIWDKRGMRRTGCDYLLLNFLWGCRKSEHAGLKWKELLSPDEVPVNSWVDLKGGMVFFYKTKNGLSHRLPLCDFAKKILQERQEWLAELGETQDLGKRRLFVFPSESPMSSTGHYSSPDELLESIRMDAGVEKFSMHDIRRTTGRMCEALNFPDKMTKRILNHGVKDVTDRYTEAEWSRFAEHMQRVEHAFMARCPRAWNALRPLHMQPMEEKPWTPKPLRGKEPKSARKTRGKGTQP